MAKEPRRPRSTRKAAAKPAAAKRRTAAASATPPHVPEAGPVTLEEARALVAARRGARASRRPPLPAPAPSPAGAPPAAVAELGEARRELRRRQEEETARRARDYADTLAVLRERGASRPSRDPRAAGRGGAAAPRDASEAFEPLRAFAEGDSWFDYPPFPIDGGVVTRLERLLGVPILNLAKAGDEVRYMLGVEQRKALAARLEEGAPEGAGPWELLLFSGGGNDIVDNPMALWVRDYDPGADPADLVHRERFAAALSLVMAGYEDLITLRDRHSAGTQLVFHGYDFAIPDGRGACFNRFGPWLRPTFQLRGFPARDLRPAMGVVRAMLAEFARALEALAARHEGVTLIPTQGLLPAQTSSWHNELHPSDSGFDRVAERFREGIRALFPDRVA